MSYRGAYSAEGLTSRPAASGGEVQLNMPSASDFDVDDEVEKLHGKVSMLKQMTGAIHEESGIRGKLIDQLEETMSQAGEALKVAQKEMKKAFKSGSSWHLCVLLMFCLALFLGFYVLYRMGKFIRFFTG